MIAAIAFSLTFASASIPQPLSAEAACALSHSDHITPEITYTIRGKYWGDGMHGHILEIPACDQIIEPAMEGEAAARISKHYWAVKEKCGYSLGSDLISGIFTGKFVERERDFQGARTTIELFVITGIETRDLGVVCSK